MNNNSPLSKNPTESIETELAHDAFFNALIEREFARLRSNDQTYLDYTGGNLYAQSQLDQHHQLLSQNVFGNPHSTNPTSMLATKLCEESRQAVLDFFNAEDYFCVFTSNASNALKIVGECYPFNEKGYLLLLADNHNSVNGIREYCRNRGGQFSYSKVQYQDLMIDHDLLVEELKSHQDSENKLFAYPAQSNVSGVKHDLSWVKKASELGWDVILDAAAYVPTSKLDLKEIQPDFVSVSFYKIFGYPTGLGCLLIRKNKFDKLKKQWFAGGTVTLASVQSSHHYLAKNHERFENGTINYLDIPALKIGLDFINGIGMQRINERVQSLTSYLHDELATLFHDSGERMVRMFGPEDRKAAGGTIIMSFFDASGQTIPFEWIEGLANARNISIRSGCFCNPGIDEVNNCLTTEELSNYFSSREEGNYYDMIHYLNKMRGATRVSVGISTSRENLDTFVEFVRSLKNASLETLNPLK